MTSSTTSSTNSVVTQGTKTYLSGGASKIDTSALVEVAYKQRLAEADKIDIRVNKNKSKNEAYTQLQTLSKDVQTSLTALRKSYGAVATDTSKFALKAGSLTTSATGVDVNSLLSVSISNTAALGTHTMRVLAVAKSHIVQGGANADPTAALGLTGDFSIGEAGGTSATISVTAGMNLNDVATAINAQSGTTKVSATVELIAPGESRLVLRAADTNKQIQTSVVSGSDIMQGLGLKDAGGAFVNVIQPTASAQVMVDNITYTRDSNKITDILTGVELNLKNASSGSDITLQITNDNSAVKDAIMSFTEKYNALRDFIVTQSKVSTDGTVSTDSVLYRDTILSSLDQSIQSLFGQRYGNGGTALATLRELGITLDKTNHFTVDETKLDEAITNKFDDVKNIFATRFTSSSTQFTLLANTSSATTANLTFNITHDGTNITGVTANGDNTLFDFSGGIITGKTGTAYEGLKFAYIGTTNATITFDMTQGLADLAANSLNKFANTVDGAIQKQMNSLEAENTSMNARADRVRERAADYRNKLIERYASFESKISKNEIVLSQMQAIIKALNSSN